ncbi:MAG: FGGY-family carbohydrate kinase [Azospirillaceae bacterium]
MNDLVVAVDVGTGSARAGLFTIGGEMIGRAERPIHMNRPRPNFAEHDSADIWRAVCAAVREVMSLAGRPPAAVRGISFDATCSLVVRARDGSPLPVSPGGEPRFDTIAWLDHRAMDEAEACTQTGHRVLDYVGGVMSPEMEIPKLMWLKRHAPETWAAAGLFLDLTDYLTWMASGSTARSQCTLTCKWTYLGHEDVGWQGDFLGEVGLEDLLERGGLPERASPVAADLGALAPEAAEALGLTTACRIGAGLIDAHAGVLGVLGGKLAGEGAARHMGLIAGTSSCVMALSPVPRPTPGIWGPYYGAVLPDLWLNEGGQSATGALLDHIIRWHSAGGEPSAAMHQKIVERVMEMEGEEGDAFARRLHVLPDFHGNRSPLADPHALGVISGLGLDDSFDSLCRLYWRTAVGIALGVRHILETLNDRGFEIDTLHVTGGHTRNPLLMALYADATQCDVVVPETLDAVLLGTAMVAATAAGAFANLREAAARMGSDGEVRRPDRDKAARFDRDYRIFLRMHEHRAELDRIAGGG